MVKGDKQGAPNRGLPITRSDTHTKKFSEEDTKTDQGLVVPRLRKACLGTVFALNIRREAASGELDLRLWISLPSKDITLVLNIMGLTMSCPHQIHILKFSLMVDILG